MIRPVDYRELTITLPDGYEAYARYWSHDRPRGAVLYHHGIQSHVGWFERSARRLWEAGYAVLQPDRRGSGRNTAARGHAVSVDQLIADAHCLRDELTSRSGVERQHVIGVSWGGRLALAAYIAEPEGVKSISLVTPGLFPRLAVSKEEAQRIGFIMLYEPERSIDIPLNDPELLTSNVEHQQIIAADPLALREATAAFFLASRRMDRMLPKLADRPAVPMHTFLVGDERIIDNEATLAFLERVGWATSRVTCYDGARHTIEYEPCAARYLDDLVSFLRDADETA
jgi:alpha-beta hydrolase superfamily lysophospholipase